MIGRLIKVRVAATEADYNPIISTILSPPNHPDGGGPRVPGASRAHIKHSGR